VLKFCVAYGYICTELKLLNHFSNTVQVLIKELLIKKIVYFYIILKALLLLFYIVILFFLIMVAEFHLIQIL